jgi:uncharacterized membrane protein YhaH (DUF805 family)
MTRWEGWLQHLANLLVGGTGLAYAWFRYLAEPLDEFSAVHPGQAPAQHLHVLTAPLLVFALGLLWRAHAGQALRLGIRDRRASGIALLAAAVPMVASGYLLQTAVEPHWRNAWIVVHLTTSMIWIVAAVGHAVLRRRNQKAWIDRSAD